MKIELEYSVSGREIEDEDFVLKQFKQRLLNTGINSGSAAVIVKSVNPVIENASQKPQEPKERVSDVGIKKIETEDNEYICVIKLKPEKERYSLENVSLRSKVIKDIKFLPNAYIKESQVEPFSALIERAERIRKARLDRKVPQNSD
jgi:uncharacterized protein (UPF0305 family)